MKSNPSNRRYSLRKSQFGLASVCLGFAFLAGGQVSADQEEVSQKNTPIQELVSPAQDQGSHVELANKEEQAISKPETNEGPKVQAQVEEVENTIEASKQEGPLESPKAAVEDKNQETQVSALDKIHAYYKEGEELLEMSYFDSFYKEFHDDVQPRPLTDYRQAWEDARILLITKGLVRGNYRERQWYPEGDVDQAEIDAALENLETSKNNLFYKDAAGKIVFIPLEPEFVLPEVPEGYWAPRKNDDTWKKNAEMNLKGLVEHKHNPDALQVNKQHLSHMVHRLIYNRFTPAYLNSKDLRYNYYLDSTLQNVDDLVYDPNVSYEELHWAEKKLQHAQDLLEQHGAKNDYSALLEAYYQARYHIFDVNYNEKRKLRAGFSKEDPGYENFEKSYLDLERVLQAQKQIPDTYNSYRKDYSQLDLDKIYQEYLLAQNSYLAGRDIAFHTDANYAFPKTIEEVQALEKEQGTDQIAMPEKHYAYHAPFLETALQQARKARLSDKYLNSSDPHYNQLLDQAILKGKELLENPLVPNPDIKLLYQYITFLTRVFEN